MKVAEYSSTKIDHTFSHHTVIRQTVKYFYHIYILFNGSKALNLKENSYMASKRTMIPKQWRTDSKTVQMIFKVRKMEIFEGFYEKGSQKIQKILIIST